jgi:hypothetical protein
MFQDVNVIARGTSWETSIRQALSKSNFFVPVITPAFLQSNFCCQQILAFREREVELGRDDLIFPLYYVDIGYPDAAEWPDPGVILLLRGREFADFRHLRRRTIDSEQVSRRLYFLAESIYRALRKPSPAAVSSRGPAVAAQVAPVPSPRQIFRAGDPVDVVREAFVPRRGVLAEIAEQLSLETGCPGLILYGRRRTGKSTMLRSIEPFLDAVIPTVTGTPTMLRSIEPFLGAVIVTVSMQDPAMFTSQRHFAHNLSAALRAALPGKKTPPQPMAGRHRRQKIAEIPSQGSSPGDELVDLMATLTWVNRRLEADGRRLLLALDEYEYIDTKIGERVFTPDLLATIRESIQTHRRIIWIFAGSHAIAELAHASWTSYLVSARTIEVPMFTLEETSELLTEPVQWSPLWARNDPTRPHFAPYIWGPGGIRRIHHETGGWPHLVQLVAETVIDLLTRKLPCSADAALLEHALDRAIVRGDAVLRELVERESRLPGEWAYLRAFRVTDTQLPPRDEAVERSLRRRLLVDIKDGVWRMRVPLMRRWLRERG